MVGSSPQFANMGCSQFEDLQARIAEQSSHMREQTTLLEQARNNQREALSMAKLVLEQKKQTTDYNGNKSNEKHCTEESVASMKS